VYVLITPVKDEEKLLRDVIESVINQTVKPVLWLIIDDGSTDGSPKINTQIRIQIFLDKNHTFASPTERHNFSRILCL